MVYLRIRKSSIVRRCSSSSSIRLWTITPTLCSNKSWSSNSKSKPRLIITSKLTRNSNWKVVVKQLPQPMATITWLTKWAQGTHHSITIAIKLRAAMAGVSTRRLRLTRGLMWENLRLRRRHLPSRPSTRCIWARKSFSMFQLLSKCQSMMTCQDIFRVTSRAKFS